RGRAPQRPRRHPRPRQARGARTCRRAQGEVRRRDARGRVLRRHRPVVRGGSGRRRGTRCVRMSAIPGPSGRGATLRAEAITFAVIATFFGLDMPDANFLAAILVLAVASFSFMGVGTMTSVLPLISPEKGAQLGFVAQGTLLVISGVYYPVSVLPQWMQWLS